VVYDHGPVPAPPGVTSIWDSFDVVRNRVAREWPRTSRQHDPISDALRERIASVVAAQAQNRTHI
jgi:hypothetical protein